MAQPEHSPAMSVHDHAVEYLKLGWGLCSIPLGTKGPNTKNWNSPALAIMSEEQARAEFHARPRNGIGLLHLVSRTCAVDVDDLAAFELILAEYGFDLETLFADAPRVVGRAGRDKAIFRVPDGIDLATVKLVWPAIAAGEKPVTVFELRAGAVQDVLPPTVHPDTQNPYTWKPGTEPFGRQIPTLPDTLVALWRNWKALRPQLESLCPWAAKPAPPPSRSRPIAGTHADVIGQFNAAHDTVQLLKANGYKVKGKRLLSPTSSTGLAGVVVLDDGRVYSHHASDPLNDGHAHDAFDLFCIFEHGGDIGRAVRAAADLMHLNALPDIPVVQVQQIIDNAQRRKAVDRAIEATGAVPDSIPGELTRIPGALGELVDHIVLSAIKPQRVLAVAASLCFGAICMARVYASRTDLRTNPYLVAVAPSTAGKDHARKVLRSALATAGLRDRIGGEDIKSGSAVFAAVSRSPATLFQLDEFGLFLKAIMNPMAGSHQADILRQLMIMRTSASSIVMGPEYAASSLRGERKDVEYPCVVIHGTTTADSFWPVLGSGHVVGGFLNRFTVVHAENPGERQIPSRRAGDIPDSITEWATQIARPAPAGGVGNLIGINPASPIVVGETEAATRLLLDYARVTDAHARDLQGTGLDALWGRAHAQAIEFALILAGSLSPVEPIINETAARWSIAFVDYWTRRLVDDCRSRIVDHEFEARCEAVLRVIRAGETRDLSYTRREIAKHWRGWRTLKPFDQDAILTSLERNGDIVKGKRQGARGPAAEAWIAREHAGVDLAPNDDQEELAE